MPAIMTQVSDGFPQAFHADAVMMPQLGQNNFLPNRFQFISLPSTLYNVDTDSLIKSLTKEIFSSSDDLQDKTK
jgi:hypothetical protein